MMLKKFNYNIFAIAALNILMPYIAFAQSAGPSWLNIISGGFQGAIGYMLYGVFYFIFTINGTLFEIAGFLINYMVQLNAEVLSNHTILSGWVVVRDLTNLGLIFGVILIAVMTILGREEYGLRSYLTTLFVMALLINFTFVISGIFIDASGVFTNYFLTRIGPGDLSTNLATALGVSNFLDITNLYSGSNSYLQSLADSGGKILTIASQLALVTLFMVSATIILFIIGVMYFIRWLVLAVLLIIAPLAWIMYAFPGMAEYTKRWWNTFFQWIFFLPVSMFFIYLAVLTVTNYSQGDVSSPLAMLQQLTSNPNNPPALRTLFGGVSQLLLAAGLLIAAVFAGQAVGGAGGSLMFNLADRGRRAMLGLVTGGAGYAGASALRGALNTKIGGVNIGQHLQRGLNRVGLIGTANALGGMMRARGNEAEEYAKTNFSNQGNDEVLTLARQKLTGVKGTAMALELIRRHKFSKLTSNEQEHYLAEAAKVGRDTDVLTVRPDLSPNPEKAKTTFSHLRSEQRADLPHEVFAGTNEKSNVILNSLQIPDIRNMARLGNEENMAAVVAWLRAGARSDPQYKKTANNLIHFILSEPIWGDLRNGLSLIP